MACNKGSALKQFRDFLDDDGILLGQNGEVQNEEGEEFHCDKVTIDYRDEGPDAWAGSERFNGPCLVWTDREGWEFWPHGVTITGYDGLKAKVISLRVTECKS